MTDVHVCYIINALYRSLTLESISHVRSSFRSPNHNLKIHIIGLDKFDVPEDVNYIASPYPDMPILWQRVYIPEIIGSDRVIFMDSDTITTRCLSKLWSVDLQDNVIGAVQHLQCETFGQLLANWSPMRFAPFNTFDDSPYFNCGVMLFDCDKWNTGGYAQKCLDAIKLYNHTKYRGFDEPGFNLVLHEKWKQLDRRWNYLPIPGRTNKRPYILHYYGEYPTGTPRHNMF